MRAKRRLLAMLVASWLITMPARADYEGYTDVPSRTFDLTVNPGCGVKARSHEDKVKRNIRIAEFYHQYYVAMEKDTVNRHDWSEWDCMAEGVSAIVGVYMPLPAKPVKFPKVPVDQARKLLKEGNAGSQKEVRTWKRFYPNLRAIPGTFRVITAWDGGVNWVMAFDGTATDGESFSFWEVNTILINEDGRITHFDCWDDGYGVAKVIKKVIGMSLDEVRANPPAYFAAMDELGRANTEEPARAH